MNFIKKIFENKIDDLVHKQFTRFSKGQFERALITIKKSKNLTIKTSYEFSNDFVDLIAQNTKEKLQVTGKIISLKDLEPKIEVKYQKKGKNFISEINTTMEPEQLKKLYEDFKDQYLLLTIKSKEFSLKTKTSIPKPGREVKDDFCKLTLPLKFLDEFLFDVHQDFKEAKIKHTYIIEEIIIPKEYKNNFQLARLNAKRKGKIIREIILNGKKIIKEKQILI